ncbi:thioesterase family protein [Homoserinimonas sp. OAct 916]|uniref:acyl-CoA thioesterase n=1 Tax=Homoserinimonas sp. OAct 916 TaxID=2211450 RepID=UPI000DBE74E1|nr:thioesterase family protein [Homoserinimonas sp. OAct 916]
MTHVHLIFRTLFRLVRPIRGRKLDHFDVCETSFRVLPTDLDVLRHMNNGVYLSILDLGRFDLLRRSGVWAILRKHGWYPVIASETITFRKSLELWQAFTVQSRLTGFDDKAVYVEQRFVRNGEIYAQALIRARFLKKSGGTVPIGDLVDAVGDTGQWPELPEWVVRWGTDVALPPTRAEAPSIWK